jgi:hypothetical protein
MLSTSTTHNPTDKIPLNIKCPRKASTKAAVKQKRKKGDKAEEEEPAPKPKSRKK